MKTLFVISLLFLSSCDGSAPKFGWFPEIWVTDSKMQVIVRQEGAELGIIKTSDEKFDEFVCIHRDEPRKAVDAYLQVIKKCKVWEQ